LFLDEIGELPGPLQGKLLRALEQRRVLPVGEEQEVPVDIRVIAATNRSLPGMIEQNQFRQDLYQRLRALSIELPALAARREDIPELVAFFVERYGELSPAQACSVSAEFGEALSTVALPGNVRELENIVRHALIHKESRGPLSLADLPREIIERLACGIFSTGVPRAYAAVAAGPSVEVPSGGSTGPGPLREFSGNKPVTMETGPEWNSPGGAGPPGWAAQGAGPATLAGALDVCERELLRSTLRAQNGNRTAVARILGVTPRSIYNKIRKHGLGT
jgi:transcriptional regulator with PAS, ATPase and Fis domain